MASVNTILTIYVWFIVCVHLACLVGIARFYQNKSKQRSLYLYFTIPIILFFMAAIRYAALSPQIVGDLWGDSLRAIGGLIVIGLGFYLLILMMGRRA